MADLSQMLSQLLSSDEGKNQVSQVLSMLGQGAGGSSEPQQPAPGGGQPGNNSMPDLGALLNLLQNNLGGGAPQQEPPQNAPSSGGAPDLSGLLAMLQNGMGGGAPQQQPSGGLPNLDVGKLMRVQQLLSSRRQNDSTALLVALKPHLKEENRKKADEAVRVLQLLDLWPLIKESGLLGSFLGGGGD